VLEMGQMYQCRWRICREIKFCSGANITCFAFYIYLWPTYWFFLRITIITTTTTQRVTDLLTLEMHLSGKRALWVLLRILSCFFYSKHLEQRLRSRLFWFLWWKAKIIYGTRLRAWKGGSVFHYKQFSAQRPFYTLVIQLSKWNSWFPWTRGAVQTDGFTAIKMKPWLLLIPSYTPLACILNKAINGLIQGRSSLIPLTWMVELKLNLKTL
jgi:hypothetical protein